MIKNLYKKFIFLLLFTVTALPCEGMKADDQELVNIEQLQLVDTNDELKSVTLGMKIKAFINACVGDDAELGKHALRIMQDQNFKFSEFKKAINKGSQGFEILGQDGEGDMRSVVFEIQIVNGLCIDFQKLSMSKNLDPILPFIFCENNKSGFNVVLKKYLLSSENTEQ